MKVKELIHILEDTQESEVENLVLVVSNLNVPLNDERTSVMTWKKAIITAGGSKKPSIVFTHETQTFNI